MLTYDRVRSSVLRNATRDPAPRQTQSRSLASSTTPARWSLEQISLFPASREADSAPSRSLTPPRPLQPKLLVGGTGDPLERQADTIADHVAAGSKVPCPIEAAAPRAGTPVVSRDLDERLRGIEGHGAALSAREQAYFGQRFGVDFGRVRVHTGAAESDLARDFRARRRYRS